MTSKWRNSGSVDPLRGLCPVKPTGQRLSSEKEASKDWKASWADICVHGYANPEQAERLEQDTKKEAAAYLKTTLLRVRLMPNSEHPLWGDWQRQTPVLLSGETKTELWS